MLGDTLVMRSYVMINKGCPLAFSFEGTDHVTVACGRSGESFELVFELDALRAMVELGNDALEQAERGEPGCAEPDWQP